jgi:hypothetical protein
MEKAWQVGFRKKQKLFADFVLRRAKFFKREP